MTIEQRLLALAAKATPEPWVAKHGGWKVSGLNTDHPQTTLVAHTSGSERGCDVVGPPAPAHDDHADANAAFIAACDPATVAALARVAEAARRFHDKSHGIGGGPFSRPIAMAKCSDPRCLALVALDAPEKERGE